MIFTCMVATMAALGFLLTLLGICGEGDIGEKTATKCFEVGVAMLVVSFLSSFAIYVRG